MQIITCFCGILLCVFVELCYVFLWQLTECDLRIWRVKWYIQRAGSVVFAMLPAWVIFLLFFLCAEDCAEEWLC